MQMSFSLSFNSLPRSSIILFSSSSFKPRNPPPPSSPSSSTGRIFHTKNPKPSIKKLETLAARDTIIDFGKHKGRMLGTLPSSYLKWVSKNLRAGDSELWAKLADEVLDDPVYQDRVEWEFAEKILHGSHESMRNVVSSKKSEHGNSVSMLLEISERFGWDNEDKTGWSKVDFELLGTSKSGRIPRLRDMDEEDKEEITYSTRNVIEGRASKKEPEDGVDGEKRRERRERMRVRRTGERDEGKTGITKQSKGISGVSQEMNEQPEPKIYNPFPGRESLLRKALNRRRLQ